MATQLADLLAARRLIEASKFKVVCHPDVAEEVRARIEELDLPVGEVVENPYVEEGAVYLCRPGTIGGRPSWPT